MNILATADWHFHNYKAHATMRDGMNSRLADLRDTWLEAVAIGKKEGCGIMTISGDLFHVRGQLKPSVVNLVQRLVREAIKGGMAVVAIAGNHDMEDYKKGDTAIDFLNDTVGFYSLDGGGVIEIRGVKVAGIPYQHDIKDFFDGARYLMVQEPDIVLMHQGVDDFKPSATMPDFGLTLNMVNDVFEHVPVFCGHYHKKHESLEGTVIQVGAPLQHTFGDEGQKRGCWIHYTESKRTIFKPITRSPKFVTLEGLGAAGAWEDGDFIRIKTSDPKKMERLIKTISASAGDVVVIHRKEFKIEESRATVDPGPVREMLVQYLATDEELGKNATEILTMYDEVCL